MDSESERGVACGPAPEVGELWVEILAPVESSRAVIARALQDMPDLPPGILIAASERGTILINQIGWTALHVPLKSVDGLQTRHSTDPVQSRTIKFYVLT